MRRSADAAARPAGGFTLLEVMMALAIIAGVGAVILVAREQASNKGFVAGNRLKALTYAEELQAEALLSTDTWFEHEGFVEQDDVFRYTLTVEEFDLSTGRAIEEDETEQDHVAPANEPGDLGTNEPVDNPHAVRRIKIVMRYPGNDDDRLEELVLETFVPSITEDDTGSSLR